jgi:hypothetical protein
MTEKADLEARLAALEQQNELLLTVLKNNGGINKAEEKEIVNNGWRVLYNPKRKNPDNMDWVPGSKRPDPAKGGAPIDRNLHTGDGMWEWGYENPDTGKIKWSGKLIGEKPPGPPADPPVPLEKLRAMAS